MENLFDAPDGGADKKILLFAFVYLLNTFLFVQFEYDHSCLLCGQLDEKQKENNVCLFVVINIYSCTLCDCILQRRVLVCCYCFYDLFWCDAFVCNFLYLLGFDNFVCLCYFLFLQ